MNIMETVWLLLFFGAVLMIWLERAIVGGVIPVSIPEELGQKPDRKVWKIWRLIEARAGMTI